VEEARQYSPLIASIVCFTVGFLAYRGSRWVYGLHSDWADRCEHGGVIRYGSGSKVWKEDEPEKFESRIELIRSSATFSRWTVKIIGAGFMVGGVVELIIEIARLARPALP
jgi:hypothetical protein